MEKSTDYLKDLTEIRSMMERSSRFMSLSGLSGVLAGIYALIGAYVAYQLIYESNGALDYRRVSLNDWGTVKLLFLDGVCVLLLSLLTMGVMTWKRAQKQKQKVWNKQARLLLWHLMVPLVTGGLLCLVFIYNGFSGVVAPLTLIFYGLALVSASKYTLSMIQNLGYMEIILGLIASVFIGYGLLFWAIGFGVLHILYGTIMYFKYEK
jgi:hypothetical protein